VFEYLCTELECFLEGGNAFQRVGLLSTGLECYRQSWHSFVSSWNASHRVGMLSRELEYPGTGLKCFLESWNDF
jgi:hypothetical protein